MLLDHGLRLHSPRSRFWDRNSGAHRRSLSKQPPTPGKYHVGSGGGGKSPYQKLSSLLLCCLWNLQWTCPFRLNPSKLRTCRSPAQQALAAPIPGWAISLLCLSLYLLVTLCLSLTSPRSRPWDKKSTDNLCGKWCQEARQAGDQGWVQLTWALRAMCTSNPSGSGVLYSPPSGEITCAFRKMSLRSSWKSLVLSVPIFHVHVGVFRVNGLSQTAYLQVCWAGMHFSQGRDLWKQEGRDLWKQVSLFPKPLCFSEAWGSRVSLLCGCFQHPWNDLELCWMEGMVCLSSGTPVFAHPLYFRWPLNSTLKVQETQTFLPKRLPLPAQNEDRNYTPLQSATFLSW